MAAQKAEFVPGSIIEEAGTQNKFMYVEFEETVHPNDHLYIDQFGVARHIKKDITGVYLPPAIAVSNGPKGQFGWVLLRGGTELTKKVLEARAIKKAETVIDTGSRINKSQTVRLPVKG